MNLIQGELLNSSQTRAMLPKLGGFIAHTLQKPLLPPKLVIDACDALAAALPDAAVLPILQGLGVAPAQAKTQLANLRLMFSPEYLTRRLETELGPLYGRPANTRPFGLNATVTEQIYPLGVLLHIAAGNMDGLPVFSVIEGLLSGNINLLKLPAVDGGLSLMILQKLCAIQPLLTEYIYVFELSSKELDSIQTLANLANAIVVWGGDDAVQALRNAAPPNVKIIEWGHKISFAYITKQGITNKNLLGLAHHICATQQLLCSSCQGVYINTRSRGDLFNFSRQFLPLLESVAQGYPAAPLSATAQNTLQLYTRRLENALHPDAAILRSGPVSITIEQNSSLTASLQFGNLWVKALPQEEIIPQLHPHKGHLQTAALLCGAKEYTLLRNTLWRAGIVRISGGEEMSGTYCGGAHDGEFPLRRYTRLVSAQK